MRYIGVGLTDAGKCVGAIIEAADEITAKQKALSQRVEVFGLTACPMEFGTDDEIRAQMTQKLAARGVGRGFASLSSERAILREADAAVQTQFDGAGERLVAALVDAQSERERASAMPLWLRVVAAPFVGLCYVAGTLIGLLLSPLWLLRGVWRFIVGGA